MSMPNSTSLFLLNLLKSIVSLELDKIKLFSNREVKSENMNTSKGRVRAPNFTPAESVHLLTILEDHKNVIENKKIDQVSMKEKSKAWESVARQYNATTCSRSRSVHNLQNAYKNLKKKTKKAYSSEKVMMPLKQDVLVEAIEDDDPLIDTLTEVGEDWPDLKEEAKKKLSHEKKAVMGTGGGPPKTSTDRIQMAIEEIKYKDALAQYEHNEKVRAIELEELKKNVERNKKLFDKELSRF